jgi:hypothetical protein
MTPIVFKRFFCSNLAGTINAKGNLGITLRRYSKVNAEQGEELIRDTVQYLNTHDYGDNHPWLVKFGNENIMSEAQKLASQGKHDLSLEMFDTLYKKKEALNQVPAAGAGKSFATPVSSPAKGSPTKTAGTGAGATRASQDMVLIGTGKFAAMIGKAQAFIRKCKHAEAEAVLAECAQFPTELLGEDSVLVVETQRLQAEICFQRAEYDKSIGKFIYVMLCEVE